jgi:hypothetical protein
VGEGARESPRGECRVGSRSLQAEGVGERARERERERRGGRGEAGRQEVIVEVGGEKKGERTADAGVVTSQCAFCGAYPLCVCGWSYMWWDRGRFCA